MSNLHDEEEKQGDQWKWTLTKTGDNEWCGKWVWSGASDPTTIPPDQPPH